MTIHDQPEDIVHEAIASLDARSADVIRRRHGFAGHPAETLEQIGATYGLTRERIRQIQKAAEAQLEQALAALFDGGQLRMSHLDAA